MCTHRQDGGLTVLGLGDMQGSLLEIHGRPCELVRFLAPQAGKENEVQEVRHGIANVLDVVVASQRFDGGVPGLQLMHFNDSLTAYRFVPGLCAGQHIDGV